jgi:hypothetical protein
MLVSAICPTYGRPPNYQHLVEEAIECFVRQETAVERELVILNDCPGQELVCHVAGVRVINHPVRYRTLGEKYNAMIIQARGDVIFPWEDDDLSLPWRIEQATQTLAQGYEYFNPRRTWYLDGNGWHHEHAHGYCHNASAFTRSAWERVGGYQRVSGAQDAMMDAALQTGVATAPPLPDDPSVWPYVYRWGVSDFHLSAYGGGDQVWNQHGGKPVQPGRYVLRPHWREDYLAARAIRLGIPVGPRPESDEIVPTSLCPNPQHWHAWDNVATDIETVEWLAATLRLLQPELCLEVGTYAGHATRAMGEAVRRNGHGRLVGLELNPYWVAETRAKVGGLPVEIIEIDCLRYIPAEPVDFAWIDAGNVGDHAGQIRHFLPYLKRFAATHDSAPGRGLWDSLQAMEREGLVRGVNLPTPRGVYLFEKIG